MDSVDERNNDVLQSFSDITQINDQTLCRAILEQNSWNLEAALVFFIALITIDFI